MRLFRNFVIFLLLEWYINVSVDSFSSSTHIGIFIVCEQRGLTLEDNDICSIDGCTSSARFHYIHRYFLLVDGANLYVYGYDARLVCTPKPGNLRTDLLHSDTLALSNDTLAVRDRLNPKSTLCCCSHHVAVARS